ncbi:hypothetical protein [Clostridium aceticum]
MSKLGTNKKPAVTNTKTITKNEVVGRTILVRAEAERSIKSAVGRIYN